MATVIPENPVVVFPAAQSAIDQMANADPVLAPLDLATIISLAQTIADGVTVLDGLP